MTKTTKKTPFRKQVKDFLNGVGALSAMACGLLLLAEIFGGGLPEGAGFVIFLCGATAAVFLWLASTIKPRKGVVGAAIGVSEW